MSLSSPNRMVWVLFASLRCQADEAAGADNDQLEKDRAALSIVLGVSAVEAFTNTFYRMLVDDPEFEVHRAMVVRDLHPPEGGSPRGLLYKLRTWPQKVLNKSFNWQKGVAAGFDELRKKRNALMHFSGQQAELNLPGIRIAGLMDTSCYDSLTARDAVESVRLAEGMIAETLRLRGVSEERVPHHLHHWIGKPPVGIANTPMQTDRPSADR